MRSFKLIFVPYLSQHFLPAFFKSLLRLSWLLLPQCPLNLKPICALNVECLVALRVNDVRTIHIYNTCIYTNIAALLPAVPCHVPTARGRPCTFYATSSHFGSIVCPLLLFWLYIFVYVVSCVYVYVCFRLACFLCYQCLSLSLLLCCSCCMPQMSVHMSLS